MLRIIMILLMFISNDPKIKPDLKFHFWVHLIFGNSKIWKKKLHDNDIHLQLIGKMMSFYKKKCFSCQSAFGTLRIFHRSINGSDKLINKPIWIKQNN